MKLFWLGIVLIVLGVGGFTVLSAFWPDGLIVCPIGAFVTGGAGGYLAVKGWASR